MAALHSSNLRRGAWAKPRAVSVRAAFIVWALGSATLWLALIFLVRGF